MNRTSTTNFSINAVGAINSIGKIKVSVDTFNKALGSLSDTNRKNATSYSQFAKTVTVETGNILKVMKEFEGSIGGLTDRFSAFRKMMEAPIKISNPFAPWQRGLENLKKQYFDLQKLTPFSRGGGPTINIPHGSSALVAPHLRPPSPTQAGGISAAFLSSNRELQDIYDRLTPAMRRNASAAQGLTTHYSLLGLATRVLVVAQLHRAINLTTQSMFDAVRTAAQLSQRIAEIQTIQGRASISSGEWSKQLRALSDNLGIPILQAAEGAYQAISNQVVSAANAHIFLAKEAALAKTTVSSIPQAVSATSTVMNAFGKTLADVDSINSKLFKAVELGRFRLDELGSQFGRTSILAAQLGVSLDEELGAFDLLTRKGVQADVAMTLLTNVFNGLLNPSKDLSKWFQSIGVNSGQAAIRTFGFTDIIGKLAAEADKGANALQDISEKFNDLRAFTGAAGLTGFFGELKGDIEALKNSTNDYNKEIETTFKSLGQRATIQLEQIRNAFTATFGGPILKSFVTFTESVGGTSNAFETLFGIVRQGIFTLTFYLTTTLALSRSKAALKSNILQLALSVDTYTSASGRAALAGRALQLSIGLIPAAISILVGYIANAYYEFQHLEQEMDAFIAKNRKLIEEASSRRLKESFDEIAKSADEYTDSIKEAAQAFNIFIANTAKDLNALKATYETAFKHLAKSIDSAFSEIDKAVSKSVHDSLREADKAEAAAERAKERLSGHRDKAEDKRIEGLLIGEDSLTKVDILEKEKAAIHRKAVEAAEKDDEKSFNRLFDLEEKLAHEQAKILEGLKNKAEKERETSTHTRLRTHPVTGLPILDRRGRPVLRRSKETAPDPDIVAITALADRIKAVDAARIAAAKEREAIEERIVKKGEDAAKTAKDEAEARNKSLEALKVLSEDLKKGKTAGEFTKGIEEADILAERAGLSPAERLAQFSKLKDAEKILTEKAAIEKREIEIEAARKQVQETEKILTDARKKETDAEQKAATEHEAAITKTEEILKGVKKFRSETRFAQSEEAGIGKTDVEFTKKFDTATSSIEILLNVLKSGKGRAKDLEELNKQLEELAVLSGQFNVGKRHVISTTGSLNVQALASIFGGKTEFTTTGKRDKLGLGALTPGGEALSTQLRATKDLVDASIKAKEAALDAGIKVDENNKKLAEFVTKAADIPKVELDAAKASADWATRAAENSKIINKGLGETLERLIRIRDETKVIPPLPVPTGAVGRAFGGSLRGGFAFGRNGIDSIPALLAPGEIVMTQSVSRAFGPFLHALNGATTQNKAQGGSVTFGDINISAAAGTTDVQVRDIATKLQRLARRGLFQI